MHPTTQHMAHSTRQSSAWGVACLALLVLLTACSPDQALKSTLPPDVPDPATQKTPAGALAAYRGALVHFRAAFSGFTITTSELADEMQPSGVGGAVAGGDTALLVGWSLDARRLPEVGAGDPNGSYAALHKVRGQAREALGALAKYAPDAPPALRGHLYALEGYAELFLADLFCSGIPLSTLEFEGDHTYRAGSTTHEVYQHALALFDSALALSADSARIVHLAQVGRARALLALGRAADAATAVAAVPDGYSYEVLYSATTGADGKINTNFAVDLPYRLRALGVERGYTVTGRKGGNGLPYVSSNDPRVPTLFQQNNNAGLPQYLLTKYAVTGDSPVVLADAVEARLIEAEAALQEGGTGWLERLNALRTDGTFTTQPNSEDPSKTDTLWHAGTGAVAGLAPLDDPGTPDSRLDLIFSERAFWLFLTGHRQGDMRRLVREYGRDPETVYPTGSYPGGGIYGDDVTAAIPEEEGLYNPKFAGCFHRGA